MLRLINYDIVFQEIPDEVTLAINISNCPNHCKSCHSPWLWEDKGEVLSEEVLISLLEKYGTAITCVCFMGGDNDPTEVQNLATFLHKQNAVHVKVGWYSGRSELPAELNLNEFQYIKTGPYVENLGGLKSRRTNQRLYKITGGELNDITSRFWSKFIV